jgi:hypothetical protein
MIAVFIIGFGGFYLTKPVNAATTATIQSMGASCTDMGCIGGNSNCYQPPGGGMCFTTIIIILEN